MKTDEAIAWFKRTFGGRIAARVAGTPFSVDLIAAIANQETGYIWGTLVQKGLSERDVLRLCVGDTLDADRGRGSFPRTKSELLAAPRGAEMFAIAREALLEMAKYIPGYEFAMGNGNKFCHGFGIFQYDIQFFKENPEYFLKKSWGDFDVCLSQCLTELKEAMGRQGWAGKTSLTDEEKVFVAIAYNKGTANRALGFKQGHESDGRYYGENIFEFLHIAQSILVEGVVAVTRPLTSVIAPPPAGPKPLFNKIGPVFEVISPEDPLRLRSEPKISTPDPRSNVLARLPKGYLVQRVSGKQSGDFIEVETTMDGVELRGFAAMKFLRRVKRATPVKAPKKTRAPQKTKGRTGRGRAKKPKQPRKPKTAASIDLNATIRAVQKKLGLGEDGKAGPETWKAIHSQVAGGKRATGAAEPKLPKALLATVDPRSEKTIATLQPEAQPYARALVLKAAEMGITIKVISGLRTYEEQNDLYAQGRTKPGRIVTNARSGYSNHNFGIAFDIGIFDGASYIPESPNYKAVGALGVELGLEWGGNWNTIKDEPHFQLRPPWAGDETEKDMLAELRSRAESGRGFYA